MSSQSLVMKFRHSSAAAASISPPTASRAPGTWRAATMASPERSSVFEGMQAQYLHSPATSSRSQMATERPWSARRPAASSPAGPAPMTIAS